MKGPLLALAIIVGIVLICALASCDSNTAHAQPLENVKSYNFYASGPCNGQDYVVVQNAWLPNPIHIVGVEITVFEGWEGLQYAFAGNSWSPDTMLWLGPMSAHGDHFYPQGLGFAFPMAGTPTAHVDLHWDCVGNKFQGQEIIYYVDD